MAADVGLALGFQLFGLKERSLRLFNLQQARTRAKRHLTEVELAFVRSKLEQRALPPEVLETKIALVNALREVEVGWERAKVKIASDGGLEKSSNGSVSAAA